MLRGEAPSPFAISELSEVLGSAKQDLHIIMKEAETTIAVATQETTEAIRFVIVVDDKRSKSRPSPRSGDRPFTTDGATSLPCARHELYFFIGEMNAFDCSASQVFLFVERHERRLLV